MNEALLNCYRVLAELLRPHVDCVEPFESVALVDEYRQYWKPEKVKVILLAESHVFTSDKDRAHKIIASSKLPGYPESYARFVCCLAYGEELMTKGNRHPANDGTPPFWKVLFSCVNPIHSKGSFNPILKTRTPNTKERMQNKIELLREMQRRGIWLIDTSIVALYNKGKKPKSLLKALKTSWSGYVQGLIQESNPEYVIVIGKSVEKAIKRELSDMMEGRVSVIKQPNARFKKANLSPEERLADYKKYYEICMKYAPPEKKS